MTAEINCYHHFLQVENLKLSYYYRPIENAALIVFIHGLGCSAKGFSSAWQSDALKDFSLLAVDLAGFGRSEKSISFSYHLEDQARLNRKLLSGLPTAPIHLVGHSMGGAVAILLAQDLACQSLSSIEGNLFTLDCGPISRTPIAMSLQEYRDTGFAQTKEFLSSYSVGTFYLEETSADAFYMSSKSLVQWSDSNKLLSMFQTLPTRGAYFYGEENSQFPVIKIIHPQIRCLQIPQAAHFPMVENPEAFYEQLSQFIRA